MAGTLGNSYGLPIANRRYSRVQLCANLVAASPYRGKRRLALLFAASLVTLGLVFQPAAAELIFERTSAYHNIRVFDEQGVRTLSFDGTFETRMSLQNPLQGHFEYTEYFHMPWIWLNVSNVVQNSNFLN